MNSFAAISQPAAVFEAEASHRIEKLPVLVLFPHNRCNCRCMMCDIWRIRQARDLTVADLEPHIRSLLELQVRWVVLSGGEPQMHKDLPLLSGLFRSNGMRVTLLTAGLLLEPLANSVVDTFDDVIVSLDGPAEIHTQIRGVPGAFGRLAKGVEALRKLKPNIVVCGRSTVQKANCSYLRETLRTAKQIGLNSISFLAADLTSYAFNRPEPWTVERQNVVALEPDEVNRLDMEVEALIREHADDIATGFIAESEGKLRRIVAHFHAHLGRVLPVAPHCNAPWVSAVIEADGTVRPCFFHQPLGNLHQKSLFGILNSQEAIHFRETLDIPNNPVCRNCVCSLYLQAGKAGRYGE